MPRPDDSAASRALEQLAEQLGSRVPCLVFISVCPILEILWLNIHVATHPAPS